MVSTTKIEKLGITLPKSSLRTIDGKRGDVPRSKCIRRPVEDYLKKWRKIKCLTFLGKSRSPLGIRGRALKTFSGIEGLDDIKEMLLRALESQERAHILLIRPPACAKSMFMLEIEKYICHLRFISQKELLPPKLGCRAI